ncbi:NmrA family NAD(P)-binding protein [Bacillus sp. DJP31]|uniref:NmrA family NAD(P)-binding protein n=1 Tax=Bacillus sp. DJP31 TaxID=3409789 RepID=UPI003BB50711
MVLTLVVKKAIELGVEKVVLLSVIKAEKIKVLPHKKIEDALKELGVTYTFIRPSNFMQKYADGYLRDMVRDGEITLPAGNGTMNIIDIRDIAKATIKALITSELENQYVELSVSNPYSFKDIAAIFTNRLQKNVIYKPVGLITYRRIMKSRKEDKMLINLTSVLYTMTRFQNPEQLALHTEGFLGEKPISFADFVKDYEHVWKSKEEA